MATLHVEAIVLRAVDHGESDRVVHLLTPATARLTAIAKGAKRSRRRFPGTLDLFNHLLVQVERRRASSLARLEHSRLIDSFAGLRAHPGRFALGCYLLELLDRLAPEGAAASDARRLFHFALAALRRLATHEPDRRLRTLLELRALDALGLRPELRRCVRCGSELGPGGEVGFHVAEGGPVGPECARGGEGLLRVHRGTLLALDQGLRLPLEHLERLALGPAALEQAGRIVGRFQRFHLGLELRSERFLDEILARAAPPLA